MSESKKTTLLIALSEGFALHRTFSAKMDRIVGGLTDADVVLVQDQKSIARTYFDSRGILCRTERIGSRKEAKNLVQACSHVVIFWSGLDLTDVVYYSRLLQKPTRIIPLRISVVRNKKKNEEYDVYIGRGSPWGNPFEIGHGPDGDSREDVIAKYLEHFEKEILPNPRRHAALLSLRGYRLGCFCAPLPCHGDILAAYLNAYEDGIALESDGEQDQENG